MNKSADVSVWQKIDRILDRIQGMIRSSQKAEPRPYVSLEYSDGNFYLINIGQVGALNVKVKDLINKDRRMIFQNVGRVPQCGRANVSVVGHRDGMSGSLSALAKDHLTTANVMRFMVGNSPELAESLVYHGVIVTEFDNAEGARHFKTETAIEYDLLTKKISCFYIKSIEV